MVPILAPYPNALWKADAGPVRNLLGPSRVLGGLYQAQFREILLVTQARSFERSIPCACERLTDISTFSELAIRAERLRPVEDVQYDFAALTSVSTFLAFQYWRVGLPKTDTQSWETR